MKHAQEVSALLLLLLLLAGGVAAYEENIREGIFLVRPDNEYVPEGGVPHYLENEDLIFFACLEQDNVPIRLSVLCTDTHEFEDIPARPWGPQNCYIGSTNLEKFDCTQAVVQADYVAAGENRKLSQRIRINKFSQTLARVLGSQFTDGGWETALDTAYGLLVLNHFPEIFPERIDRAVEYLKLNRNEADKCWPAEDCRISTTSSILFLLEEAGFEDLRIQNDGRLYLERTQEYLNPGDWNVTILDHRLNLNNTINTSCVYEYNTALQTFTLAKNPEEHTIPLTPSYEKHVGVVCTENVHVTLTNQYGEEVVTYQGDNFSYTIPWACWTRNNEHISCDLRATLYAVNSPLESTRRSQTLGRLAQDLQTERTAGKYLGPEMSIINDALYAHAGGASKADVIERLLYSQTNLGGWQLDEPYYDYSYYEVAQEELDKLRAEVEDNISKDIVATGHVVMSLLKNGFERDDEVLQDAERWVSLNEDETSLNYTDEDLTDPEKAAQYAGNRSLVLEDTKRNAMAFYVLQNNARPILRADPRIIVMNKPSLELDIINPTVFELDDLTYELSSNIQKHLAVEDKDYVGAYSFRRVTISRKSETPINDIGYLRVLQSDNEYLKVPIILESQPRLEITLPEQLTVFGSSALLPFEIYKSDHEFQCSLEWTSEGIAGTAPFDINGVNNTYDFPVRFSSLETENEVYAGNITCTASKVTFRVPFATNIVRFSNKPLRVAPSFISLEDARAQQIEVENALDENIDVVIENAQQDPYIVLSDTYLSLRPGETRNITVQAVPPEGEGYNTTNAVVLRTFNVEERVALDVAIAQPQAGWLSGWRLWAALGLLALALGAAGYFGYKNKDRLKAFYKARFSKEDIRSKILRQVQELEREEELVAIRNMIRIQKLQGLKDNEIRQRLVQEGYSEGDIDAALTMGEKKQPAAGQGQKQAQ